MSEEEDSASHYPDHDYPNLLESLIKYNPYLIRSFTENGYIKGPLLKEGTWGHIYECTKIANTESLQNAEDTPRLLAKIQRLSTEIDRTYWYRESYYAKYVSEVLGIGPKIFVTLTTEEYKGENPTDEVDLSILIMERWDESLDSYQKRRKSRPWSDEISSMVRSKLRKEVDTLHKAGVLHADIVDRNIFVKLDQNDMIIDVTLGDMGAMRTIAEFQEEDCLEDLKGIFHYHSCINPEFFTERGLDFQSVRKDPRWLDLSHPLLSPLDEKEEKPVNT